MALKAKYNFFLSTAIHLSERKSGKYGRKSIENNKFFVANSLHVGHLFLSRKN